MITSLTHPHTHWCSLQACVDHVGDLCRPPRSTVWRAIPKDVFGTTHQLLQVDLMFSMPQKKPNSSTTFDTPTTLPVQDGMFICRLHQEGCDELH